METRHVMLFGHTRSQAVWVNIGIFCGSVDHGAVMPCLCMMPFSLPSSFSLLELQKSDQVIFKNHMECDPNRHTDRLPLLGL